MNKHLRSMALSALLLATPFSHALATETTTLRIGTEGAYPPFNYFTADGKLAGFDIEIGHALCEKLKANCTFVAQDWDGIIPALMARKYDAIVASMSITEERKKKVDFSAKYYNTPAKFAAKNGMFSDDSPASLAGKTIGVQRGTIHDDYVSAVYKDSDIKRYGTQDEVYLDLIAGRLDAIIADSTAIDEGLLKTAEGKSFAFFGKDHTDVKYFGEGAGIAVRKGEEDLRDAFSAAIKAIREDGTYAKINSKYFDFDIYGSN